MWVIFWRCRKIWEDHPYYGASQQPSFLDFLSSYNLVQTKWRKSMEEVPYGVCNSRFVSQGSKLIIYMTDCFTIHLDHWVPLSFSGTSSCLLPNLPRFYLLLFPLLQGFFGFFSECLPTSLVHTKAKRNKTNK